MADAETCPLCEGPNACGLEAGQSTCWCFDTPIDAGVLARVPEADQSVRCICRSCATAPIEAAPDPPQP